MKRFFKTMAFTLLGLVLSMNLWGATSGDVFSKITKVSDLEDGDEIIFVNSSGTSAMSTTQYSNNRGSVTITTKNGRWTYPTVTPTVQILTVKVVDGKYGFHTGSGYLYSASTSKNYLNTTTTPITTAPTTTSLWSLSIAESGNTNQTVTIQNNTNTAYYLQWNDATVSQYKQTMSNGCIYKKAPVIPVTSLILSEAGVEKSVLNGQNVGDTYELPSSDATCGDKEFVGWSSVEITTPGNKPTSDFYKPGDEVTLEDNNTFYAVFAEKKTGTVTKEIKNLSFTAAEDVTYSTGDDNLEMHFLKGGSSTNPGNYNNGVRLYQAASGKDYGGYITIECTTGNILEVSFQNTKTYATSVKYSTDKGTTLSDPESVAKSGVIKKEELSTKSFYLYNVGTDSNGRLEIDLITIKYEGGQYSNYTTSCAAAGNTIISYNKNTEDEVTGDVPESVEQENGVAYTVSTATLTRSGYNFVGWNTDKDATEGITTIPAASITGSPITLYAIWQAKTVQSVVVSGNPTKKNYEAGETFNPAGLTVTINYSDESVVVTEGIVWAITPDNGVLTKGQTSVNVTATALGKTSESFEVKGLNVTAASLTLTWNLSIVDDELTTATKDKLEWTNSVATMTVDKEKSSTDANNYYPGTSGKTYTSTRFYASSVLTIAPIDNNTITKVEFTATSNSYATALKNSTWTNATSGNPVQIGSSDSYSLTVTPTDGKQAISATIGNTCGFTAVKVYYQPGATMTSIAVKTAPSKVVYNAGESFNPAGLVITATYDDATTKDITYDANDTKWEFIPELTEKLTGKDDAVAITYNGVTIDPFLDITVNRIASNLAAVSATKILVVNDMPDVSEWYTIAANYDGTVAFSSDNTEVFGEVENVWKAKAAGSATLTITAPQTDTYAQASVTIDVTVNAAAVPCSVKWMNNGEEYTVGGPSTVVNAGQKVTKLPTAPQPCDAQHEFMGWTNAAITTPQADAPGILFTDVAGAPTVDADGTVYYAVYAVESQEQDEKKTITLANGSYTGSEATGKITWTETDVITIVQEKGTTPSGQTQTDVNKSYVSSPRWYKYNKITFTPSVAISKIEVTTSSSEYVNALAGSTFTNATATGTTSEPYVVTITPTNQEASIVVAMGAQSRPTAIDVWIPGEIQISDYSTECATIELDKIELSGTYPQTFLLGDELNHEGMTVTASYKNSATTKDVTNLATFTGYNANALGEQTITVSYTEGEGVDAITKTATYNVTVNDWPNKTIQEFITAQGTKCYLTAFVSNLNGDQYDLTDNSGTIHGYKYTLATGVSALANGDRIRVKAEEYEYFQGKTHEVKNIVVLEKLAFSAIAVSGTMSVTEYTEGNTLNSDGLVVKGKYADEDEAKHVITEGITWDMPKAVLGSSEYDVKATVGGLSDTYHVTGITVNAAKVLESLSVVGTPKTTYWVGEQFNYDGLVFKAKYENDDNLVDVTDFCTFSREAGQITDAIVNETITVSYSEGEITKDVKFVINANWMTLADLVAKGQPSTDAVKVWVKVTNAEIKAKSYSYITTDVNYGDNQTQEVKIYQNGVSNDWEVKGKISGELKDVDWKHYTSGGNDDWELCPTNWDWVTTYTPAPKVDVTGVTLNETALELKAGKTATLVATVAPDNATDKSVTWSIVNDNANGKITVDQEGKVTVAADATEGATATVTVTTTDGGKTATCNVKVIANVATNFGLYYGELTAGDYIISYQGYLLKNTITSNRFDNVTDIAAVNNIISTDNEAIIWHIAKSDDNWTICSAENGKYAGSTGSKNEGKMLDDATTDNALWIVASDENSETYDFENIARGKATSNKDNKWLRNNGASGWACYTTQIGGALTLYKAGFTPAPALSTLEITGELGQTEYFLGKSVKYDGLSVVGHYSDGSEAAITDGITWSADPATFTELGEKVVKITATVQTKTGEVSGNKEFNVTVVESHQINYGLVTSVNTLYDGAVVVLGAVYEKDDEPIYAVNQGFYTSNYKYLLAYRSNIENSDLEYENEVMKTANASEITLKKVENGWLLIDEDNNYICGAADLSKTTNVEDATVWTISIADGKAVIAAGDYQFFYNKNSGAERFKTYASTTSTQEPVGIYMKNLVAVRTGLTAGKIGTICYPQAIAAVDGANLYQPNYKDDAVKNIYFSTPDEYKAGLPMIFQADREIMKVLFTGDAVTDPIAKENARGMVGNLTDSEQQIDPGMYIFTQNKLWITGEGCIVDPNRAYVDLNYVPFSDDQLPHDLPSGAPRRTISLGNASASTPTGVNNLREGDAVNMAQKFFINGNIVIKNQGQLYNAQGNKLK